MALWMLVAVGIQVQAISSEQVLKTALSDGGYVSYDEVQTADSRNPLRNVEAIFGYEKGKKKFENEFGFKMNFKSWSEWHTGRSTLNHNAIMKARSLAWALRDRYNTLLTYQLNEKRKVILEEVSDLAEKYFKAQAVSLRAGRGSPKSFISARGDLFKYQRSALFLKQEQEGLKKRLRNWVPQWSPESFEKMDLPEVQDIVQILKATKSEHSSISKQVAEEELLELDQELRIARGRENQWVKSLELTYAEADHEQEYKAQLTVQVPFLGSDDTLRQKQNELILKKALKRRDVESTADQLQAMKLQVFNLFDLYKNLEDSRVKVRKTGQDPLGGLEARLIEIQVQLELLNQQQEITILYLDFLLENGSLARNPNVNYLSKSKGLTL